MVSDVSAQMLAAHRRATSLARDVQRHHQTHPAFIDIDEFQHELKNEFFKGVHASFSIDLVKWLRANVGFQQQIADSLGLKDRTSVSQMLRAGKIDGTRITAIAYQYGLSITIAARGKAAYAGFARATSIVKAKLYPNDEIVRTMSSQDFADLTGVFASDEWEDAIRSHDPAVARAVAVKIIDESELGESGKNRSRRYRAEQCVMLLKDVEDTWGDSGAVTLCLLSDCIPTFDSGREAIL